MCIRDSRQQIENPHLQEGEIEALLKILMKVNYSETLYNDRCKDVYKRQNKGDALRVSKRDVSGKLLGRHPRSEERRVGKTGMALHLARNAAMAGYAVAVYSREMQGERLADRWLTAEMCIRDR